MIISFAMTVSQLLAGQKDVTRRDWPDIYARRFALNKAHDAYDKGVQYGGKKIGTIEIVSIQRESLDALRNNPDYARSEMQREGGFELNDFLRHFESCKHGAPYRIQFKFRPL